MLRVLSTPPPFFRRARGGAQGLWQATYGGIGAGLGGLLGGLLLDRQGGQGLFFTAAAAVAAGGLAAAGVGLMMQRAGVDARPKAE